MAVRDYTLAGRRLVNRPACAIRRKIPDLVKTLKKTVMSAAKEDA
jgi:hypothetical protein